MRWVFSVTEAAQVDLEKWTRVSPCPPLVGEHTVLEHCQRFGGGSAFEQEAPVEDQGSGTSA
jgi:hypothetical protein